MTQIAPVLLDTNIVLPALSGASELSARIERYPYVFIPLVVVAELRYGAFHSSKPTEQFEKVECFIRKFQLVFQISRIPGFRDN